MHWINGEFLNQKVAAPNGRLKKLLTAGRSNEQIVEEFYLRALSRSPIAKEQRYWLRQLVTIKSAKQRREALEDFVWSLLSCREFQTR